MKRNQDEKTKRVWRKLLIEAKRSKQLYNRKQLKKNLNSSLHNDQIKFDLKKEELIERDNEINRELSVKLDDHTNNELSNQSTNEPTDQLANQSINQTNDQLTDNYQQSIPKNNELLNSINRLNSTTIDDAINEIQHQILSRINNQPFYLEQKLKKRIKKKSNEDEILCRVCFLPTNEMYQPCRCSGTMKYIHRKCLSDWIKTNRSKNCNICYAEYTGLTIVYHYPAIREWLIKDTDSIKQLILFLFLIAVSFILYSKKTFEFYFNEFKFYRKQFDLVRFTNSITKRKLIKNLEYGFSSDLYKSLSKNLIQKIKDRNLNYDVNDQNFRTLFYSMNKIKFSEIQKFNLSLNKFDLNNLTKNRFSNLLINGLFDLTKKQLFNLTMAYENLNLKNELINQVNQIQNVSNLASSFRQCFVHSQLEQCNELRTNETVNEYYLENNQLIDEHQQYISTLKIFVWSFIIYLMNDLIQITMYVGVFLVFKRYFRKEYHIWRYNNRIAEVKFDGHHSDLMDAK